MERSEITSCLCGVNTLPEEHTICNGALKTKCMRTGCCCIKNLNDQQVAYVKSSFEEDVYLNACPGSGKTEVIGIKVAYEIKRWSQKNNGIAVLTFTNSAEEELYNRIGSFMNRSITYPHYVGTFTSWLHGYIGNPFVNILTKYKGAESQDRSIKLVDSNCKSDFLNAYLTKYSYGSLGRISANHYHFDTENKGTIIYNGPIRDGQQILDEFLAKRDWAKKELGNIKLAFWKKGFATYEDIEQLTHRLLETREDITKLLAKRFPVIIVDECQDLSYVQLEILRLLHKQGTNIHLVGDLDQAIYEFRLIEPQKTAAFIKSIEMHEQQLTQNYRSVDSIVCATGAILCKENGYATGIVEAKTENPLIAILYQKNQEQQVIAKFEKLVNEVGLSLNNSRIIVRNNSLREKLYGRKTIGRTINTVEDFAHFLFLRESANIDDYKLGIRILARAIQRCFFKDEQHASFDLLSKPANVAPEDWRRIIIALQKRMDEIPKLKNLSLTWGEWKAILTDSLDLSYSATIPGLENKIPDFGRLRSGAKDTIVRICFESNETSLPCKVETVHGCKGMSLDAVLFMSSYKKSADETGAYWGDWFAKNQSHIEENHRLAYVAFSRARHLLVIGIPNPLSSPVSPESKAFLKSIGFLIDCME